MKRITCILLCLIIIALGQIPMVGAQVRRPPALLSDTPEVLRPPNEGAASLRIESRLSFTHVGVEDGLSNNNVTAMLQDRDGFLWIGTRGGLNRYDGYRFTRYIHNPYDASSISANHVRDLYEDSAGGIWVATHGGGLDCLDPRSGAFTHYRQHAEDGQNLGGSIVFTVMQDAAGTVWFGGPPNTGLNRYDAATGRTTRMFKDAGADGGLLPNTGIWQIHEDADGVLWCVADFVLTAYNPRTGHIRHYHAPDREQHLNALVIDRAGRWWVGGSQGLYAFEPLKGTFTLYQPEHAIHVDALQETSDGVLWVGTEENGLYRFDPATRQFTGHSLPDSTDAHSLSHRNVNCMSVDAAGLLWIGTFDGVDVWDPQRQQFRNYRILDTDSTMISSMTMAGDADGRLWVGTDEDLLDIDPTSGEVTPYALPADVASRPGAVTAIYADADDGVWVAAGLNLFRFDRQATTFTPYTLVERTPRQGPPANIFSMYVDEFGALWVAAEKDGLFRLDRESRTVLAYQPAPKARGEFSLQDTHSIADVEVRAVAGDRRGHLWIGYQNGIFSQLDLNTGLFTHYGPDPENAESLHSGWIETIYAARDGMVWIGSQQGLSRFDPQQHTFRLYTEQDGLAVSYVLGIVEDAAGTLWLSMPNSIANFDPVTGRVRNYDANDGVSNGRFHPCAAFSTNDGRILFGGQESIVAFQPDALQDARPAPPLLLTELQVNHRPVTMNEPPLSGRAIWHVEQLVFTHEAHAVAFEFAALTYTAPHNMRYRYRLEGFDPDWREVDSTRRFAVYTDLHAGAYRFRVQAAIGNGAWSAREAAVAVTILPPWWATAWFRATAGIGLALLLIGSYQWRISSMRRRNARLEAEVQERTRELSVQTQELIRSHADVQAAKQAAEVAQEAAEEANQAKSRFLAQMSHELRTPLNSILGFTRILARVPHSFEEREWLATIQRSGEHLLNLINHVLDLSKIEAGRTTLDESVVDLEALLRDLDGMFRLRAEQKGLRLQIEHDPAILRHILTDAVKLRQILINLLGNAVKFTETGFVALALSVERRPIDETDAAASDAVTLTFAVSDSGPGLTTDEAGTIFDPFEQTEHGRRTGTGTGLGLPISRKLAQLLGGDVRVDPSKEQGTRFIVDIRARIVESPADADLPFIRRVCALSPEQPLYRLLIVDDTADNRNLLRSLLQPLGFEVREAENGQEALEIWHNWHPHLIWMDMRMPVMDGYEATQRIRAAEAAREDVKNFRGSEDAQKEHGKKSKISHQKSQIPIIALTASSFPDDRTEILAAGCDDYLRKPFQDQEIFDLLHAHLGVQFEYDDEQTLDTPDQNDAATQLTPGALAALPAEWRTMLKQGAEEARPTLLLAVIDLIHEKDAALAATLRRVVDNFAYEEILQRLEESGEN